ncbi:MAG TPA: hypothetical protein VLM79_19995 [Kofleriaceae bacterium]|nr:hypothetical protein [Kofleriaceae bacterium]
MSNTLLVAGRRPEDTSPSVYDMDEVENKSIHTRTFRVLRCDSPPDLLDLVASEVRARGKLDILDLYDHGNIGGMLMGDDVLFATDSDVASSLVNEDLARGLREFLSETAHVRLLGCSTSAANGPSLEARLLLLKLADALGGHRMAFGTITPIQTSDFGHFGFRRDVEIVKLFSSAAALDSEPPLPEGRGRNIDITRLRARG